MWNCSYLRCPDNIQLAKLAPGLHEVKLTVQVNVMTVWSSLSITYDLQNIQNVRYTVEKPVQSVCDSSQQVNDSVHNMDPD